MRSPEQQRQPLSNTAIHRGSPRNVAFGTHVGLLYMRVQGKQPVGVNMGGYFPNSSLRHHDHHPPMQHNYLKEVRILISDALPLGVLCLAPHLLWIGRPQTTSPLRAADIWASPAAQCSGTATCMPKLVVVDMLVSLLIQTEWLQWTHIQKKLHAPRGGGC